MIVESVETSARDTIHPPLPSLATRLHPQQPLPHPLHRQPPKNLSAVQLNNHQCPILIPTPAQIPIPELVRVTTPLAMVKLCPLSSRQPRLEWKLGASISPFSTRAKVRTIAVGRESVGGMVVMGQGSLPSSSWLASALSSSCWWSQCC